MPRLPLHTGGTMPHSQHTSSKVNHTWYDTYWHHVHRHSIFPRCSIFLYFLQSPCNSSLELGWQSLSLKSNPLLSYLPWTVLSTSCSHLPLHPPHLHPRLQQCPLQTFTTSSPVLMLLSLSYTSIRSHIPFTCDQRISFHSLPNFFGHFSSSSSLSRIEMTPIHEGCNTIL